MKQYSTLFTIITMLVLILFSTSMFSQSKCEIDNQFFQAGEELQYDLYFKLGLVNTKAGNASLSATNAKYDNEDAYRLMLKSESTGAARSFFSLNDTLISYVTKSLVPLAYIKNAHEGGDYTAEKLKYKYNSNGKIGIHTVRVKNGQQKFDENLTAKNCVYDLLSVVYYARTLEYSKMKKGDQKSVEFISGKRQVHMVIEHQGEEVVKANDGKKYDCVKLVLSLANASHVAFDPNAKKEEAMKVFISNDNNRMPVRMEFKLKVGGTRGVLRSYKGVKHPVKAN